MASSRFTTLAARVPPLIGALSALCAVLAAYALLAPTPLSNRALVAGILALLALLTPWLMERRRDDDWLAAGLLAGLPLAALWLSQSASLWLVLIVSALGLATVLSGLRLWLALAGVWAAALLIRLLAPATVMGSVAFEHTLQGVVLAVVAGWGRSALRLPPQRPALTTTPTRTALERVTQANERLRSVGWSAELLEEVVSSAKAVGPYVFAAFVTVDRQAGTAKPEVVLGASGQTLGATEGLDLTWSEFAPLLRDDERVGTKAYLAPTLPFRTVADEHYLLVPANAVGGAIIGLLIVGALEPNARGQLADGAPLLELLAAQCAAGLETAALQLSLAHQLEETATTMNESAASAQRARSLAENLYDIVRALSTTLDPQHLLDQALILIAQATQAQRGGIMLVEPRTGRLVFGTNLERHLTKSEAAVLERGQGLAGWVIVEGKAAIVHNTSDDPRWLVRSEHDQQGRAALAVPLEHDGTVTGVIVLLHNTHGHFNAEHAQFVQIIGNQVATMLNNAHQHQALVETNSRLMQQLQQREEEASRSLAIVRSIGDGVVVGDRVGRIRLINPAAERLLNIEASKYLGQSLVALPGLADLDPARANPESFEEFELHGKIIRAFTMPVVTSNNEWLGSVVVYHDVSATQLADRLKTEFVATASHEMRTPLTSIGGYIDLLLLNTLGPINDQQRQFLGVVKFNIERLTAILNDLLDVSRIESGNMRLQRQQVSLEEIIHGLVMEMHQQWSQKHISLALDMPSNLPAVVADPERLRQALGNLLSNAYKFTFDHGNIDLIVRQHDDRVSITVRDSGVGIAVRDQEHIFTRFYRTENPLKEQAGGAGLGLTLAKSIVELHGGKIGFESVEGSGSTFIVELPLGGDSDWTPAAWLEGVE